MSSNVRSTSCTSKVGNSNKLDRHASNNPARQQRLQQLHQFYKRIVETVVKSDRPNVDELVKWSFGAYASLMKGLDRKSMLTRCGKDAAKEADTVGKSKLEKYRSRGMTCQDASQWRREGSLSVPLHPLSHPVSKKQQRTHGGHMYCKQARIHPQSQQSQICQRFASSCFLDSVRHISPAIVRRQRADRSQSKELSVLIEELRYHRDLWETFQCGVKDSLGSGLNPEQREDVLKQNDEKLYEIYRTIWPIMERLNNDKADEN